MHQFVAWLSSNTATLSILGAAIAFIWSTTQQLAQRKAEAGERQFQAFHEIVEKVVSPERTDGVVYIDRQAAFVFELRHFPRYYDFTERMLVRLKKKWVAAQTRIRTCGLRRSISLWSIFSRTNRSRKKGFWHGNSMG